MKKILASFSSRRRFLVRSVLVCACVAMLADLRAWAENPPEKHWYRGNTHCHSIWSDGREFPEVVVDEYKKLGYDFLVCTDHSTTQTGERWVELVNKDGKVRVSDEAIERCRNRFGKDAVEIRQRDGKKEVKARPFDQTRKLLEEPGKFLLIQGEESSLANVHVSVLNSAERIRPIKDENLVECIRKNLDKIEQDARQAGRTTLVQFNHPNWSGYRLSAVVLADALEAKFLEFRNCIPNGDHQGNDRHPGEEKLWDLASTLRIAHWKKSPPWGIASDDAHVYFPLSQNEANPGRGWIVVRAAKLETEALMQAMLAGDFYASTGVALDVCDYDSASHTLRVKVRETPGVKYRVEFLGTLRDSVSKENLAKAAFGSMKVMALPEYSRIGEVLQTTEGPQAEYRFTGKELYVRAVIHSDKKKANAPPNAALDFEQAWSQPIVEKK
jgi:predicted metal-dependent phosphoesterase TrpH